MGRIKVGEHVQIDGLDGVYVVLRLDADREAADLLQISGARRIENNVSLQSIRSVRDQGKLTEAEPA